MTQRSDTLLLAATIAAATLATPALATEKAAEAVATQQNKRDLPQVEQSLEEVVVLGQRKSRFRADVVQVGAFRNQSIMDTPATIQVMTRSLLDAQGTQGLEDVLRNTPGVTQSATSPTTSPNFANRGVLMNARTNYRLNGALQIISLGTIPIENKQRVELLKGVSALYYGISTPSGIVNLVTKRAGADPITSFYVNGDSERSFGGGVDIGRSFGDDEQFGLRVNAYGTQLELPIDGVDGHRYMASGAFDWRVNDRLSMKFDLEHYRRVSDEPGGITLPAAVAGRITLPKPPNSSNRYAPQDAPYRSWVTNALGRIDYLLDDTWSVRGEVGHARTRRQRAIANIGNFNLATGNGQVTATYVADQEYSNLYWRTELSGKVDTFGIQHELLFGYARNRQEQEDQNTRSYAAYAQNLYNPIDISFGQLRPTTNRLLQGTTNVDTGLYVMDMARITDQILLIGGVRYVDYKTETRTRDTTITTWTPTGGIVFRPTEETSLYFTYIEGLESAGVAPDSAVNAGEVMPSVRSKQIEVGARAELFGTLMSLAYFRIDRALSYTDAASNRFVVNGRAIHKGVEASLQGDLGGGVSAFLAGQYLEAEQRRTANRLQEGKRVEGTAKWSGSAFIEYRPEPLPELGLSAGVYYNGDRYADALNRAELEGYTTLSLGASYRVPLTSGQAVTFRVNADNVTDERYWATGGSALFVGLGRVVRASATVDF